MKKIVLFALAMLLINTISFSQKCNFVKNEVDKFTGVKILETKSIRLSSKPSFYVSGLKNDNQYLLRILAWVNANSPTNFSIEKGQQLIFLLANGDTIMLNANETILGDLSSAKNVGGLYITYEGTVRNDYNINSDQLERIKKSNLKAYRFFVVTSDNRKFPINKEFSSKGIDDLMKMANCLTSE